MALKATVFKATLNITDLDRQYYQSHTLTLARHPSETDERMMIRLLAFALQAVNMLAFSMYTDAGMILLGTVVAGMAYGSLMSVFPSTTADFYGLKNYGANYGVLYTAWGVSGFVGPLLAGLAVDITGTYEYAYMISAALLGVAIVLGLMTRPVKMAVEPEAVPARA